MGAAANIVLRQIGHHLDHHIFPRIRNGGVVVPSDPAVQLSHLGTENQDEHQASRSRKPESRSQERAPGWQGPARAFWSPHQTASVVCTDLRTQYEDELDAVDEAYPGIRVWRQEDAVWLLTESSLLPDLPQRALFLTGISFSRATVRSWGFWRHSLVGYAWIGPRHTNFPDGSVCAFEPTDGTWGIGDSMVALLDLYTLWALRHLHFQLFGRWPGQQAVCHPYERLLEVRADEHCGCGDSDRVYGECCRSKDLARDRIADAVHFIACVPGGGLRTPPRAVVEFVRQQKEPPTVRRLY